MVMMNNFCEGCQYYNTPYWSIINPCNNCPRIYGKDVKIITTDVTVKVNSHGTSVSAYKNK